MASHHDTLVAIPMFSFRHKLTLWPSFHGAMWEWMFWSYLSHFTSSLWACLSYYSSCFGCSWDNTQDHSFACACRWELGCGYGYGWGCKHGFVCRYRSCCANVCVCVWCAFWYGLVGNVLPMRYSLKCEVFGSIFLGLDLISMGQMYCHAVTLVLVCRYRSWCANVCVVCILVWFSRKCVSYEIFSYFS